MRNARAAVLAFAGDVYQGLDVRRRWDARDYTEAQKTVRILSGLYGVLRPLDLIQPYRLEMGIPLATDRGNSLYAYWGSIDHRPAARRPGRVARREHGAQPGVRGIRQVGPVR